MPSKDNRKLAAIMFADIVGYSRMMAGNEERTLELLKDFENICSSIIAENNGVIIKKVGDELFCEFSSAKDAVDSALEIQKTIQPYNDSRPKDFKLQVRIGIHIGDVLKRDDDVFGDGVNVASRIQPFAKPGGICVSNAVRDAISSHPNYKIQSEGQQELKNIVEKHTLYRVETGFETISQKKSFNKTGYHYLKKWIAPILLIAIITTYILYNNKSPVDKINDTFLIHITSDSQLLEDDLQNWESNWGKKEYGSDAKIIDNNIVNQIRKKIIPRLNSEIINSDIKVYYTQNQEEYRMMNKLSVFRADFTFNRKDKRDSIPELKKEYELKLNEINQVFDYFDNLYNTNIDGYILTTIDNSIIVKGGKKVEWLNIFPTIYIDRDYEYIDTGFFGLCNDCDLKLDENNLENVYNETVWKLKEALNKERFGGKRLGRVDEIMDSDIISIKLDASKIRTTTKGMTFNSRRAYRYSYGESTLNQYISDREMVINYYKDNPQELNSEKTKEAFGREAYWLKNGRTMSSLLSDFQNEIDSLNNNREEVIADWSGRGNYVWDNIMFYNVKIIKVEDDKAIAKIISRKNPYVTPKVGDIVRVIED